MKRTKTGQLNQQSPAFHDLMNAQVGPWTGNRAQVRAYYARIAHEAAEDLRFRRPEFAQVGLDVANLNITIERLEALAEEMGR